MDMRRPTMRELFPGMAVGVKMRRAVIMAVAMEMDPVMPEPPQQLQPKPDQHDSNRRLEPVGERIGDDLASEQRRTGKGEQCQRVAEPPGQAVLDDVTDLGAAVGDAGDCGDMVGLQRMLQAQQKTQRQYCQHSAPKPAASSLETGFHPSKRRRGADSHAAAITVNHIALMLN